MRHSVILISITILSACTVVTVRPVDSSLNIRHVCVQNNPEVTVRDFTTIVRDGFDRHGISTEVFSGRKPNNCEYVLTYTALRSWDMSTYLSHAELRLEAGGRQIAYAEYHLRGKGGFALNKWAATKTKMDPVIDELLAQYEYNPAALNRSAALSTDEELDAQIERLLKAE